jgi:hypothetical protein
MKATDVAILGTGMSDMSRRDQDPDTMAYEVVHEALGDAGVSTHELGLVIMGNAMAGRLSDQACVRGQTWLRKAGDAGGDRTGPPDTGARRREDVDR